MKQAKTREDELKEEDNELTKAIITDCMEGNRLTIPASKFEAYDHVIKKAEIKAELKGIAEGRRLQKIEDDKETMKCIQDYSEKLRKEGRRQALADVEKIIFKAELLGGIWINAEELKSSLQELGRK